MGGSKKSKAGRLVSLHPLELQQQHSEIIQTVVASAELKKNKGDSNEPQNSTTLKCLSNSKKKHSKAKSGNPSLSNNKCSNDGQGDGVTLVSTTQNNKLSVMEGDKVTRMNNNKQKKPHIPLILLRGNSLEVDAFPGFCEQKNDPCVSSQSIDSDFYSCGSISRHSESGGDVSTEDENGQSEEKLTPKEHLAAEEVVSIELGDKDNGKEEQQSIANVANKAETTVTNESSFISEADLAISSSQILQLLSLGRSSNLSDNSTSNNEAVTPSFKFGFDREQASQFDAWKYSYGEENLCDPLFSIPPSPHSFPILREPLKHHSSRGIPTSNNVKFSYNKTLNETNRSDSPIFHKDQTILPSEPPPAGVIQESKSDVVTHINSEPKRDEISQVSDDYSCGELRKFTTEVKPCRMSLQQLRREYSVLSKGQLIELAALSAWNYPSIFKAAESFLEADPYSRRLMVRGLSFYTTDEKFRLHFQQFGELENAAIIRFPDGRSQGYGFLIYKNRQSAKRVLESKVILDGRNIAVKLAADQFTEFSKDDTRTAPCDRRKLFVRNIRSEITQEYLEKEFSVYGPIEECAIIRTSKGAAKGYGFVTFVNAEDALEASKTPYRVMDGWVVFVAFSTGKYRSDDHKQISKPTFHHGPSLGNSSQSTHPSTDELGYVQRRNTTGTNFQQGVGKQPYFMIGESSRVFQPQIACQSHPEINPQRLNQNLTKVPPGLTYENQMNLQETQWRRHSHPTIPTDMNNSLQFSSAFWESLINGCGVPRQNGDPPCAKLFSSPTPISDTEMLPIFDEASDVTKQSPRRITDLSLDSSRN